MTAAVREETQVCLFVRRDIDDYGLDPYEFRLYARISRRAGNEDGEAWESVPSMARACCMSVTRARIALQLLELARLIESIERPGYSTLRRLTPQHRWVSSDRLPELRQFIRLMRATTATPTRSSRGTLEPSRVKVKGQSLKENSEDLPNLGKESDPPIKSDTPTPIKSDSTPRSNLIPLPLSNLVDEGTPSEGITNKVLPQSPLTPQGENSGEGKEEKKESSQSTISGNGLLELSGQLALILENALKPVFAALVAETKQALSGIKAPAAGSRKETEPSLKPKQQAKTCQADQAAIQDSSPVLEELSRLVDESVESLRRNPNLSNALAEHHEGVSDAMLYFKQAVATWKKKPGLGLFISALKKGLKPSPTAPFGGWGDWANEATKRQLMEYSHSYEGDIMVHFFGGVQKLWSEVRSLEWSELEAIITVPRDQGCPA